tara:strand:- start:181 stop:924 length:744 start_codon:yes stop_codon:yes gene_type:complete
MAKFAKGKYAQSISDRSGQAFPYLEMLKEWNGSLVHVSEFEPKSPQLDPKVYGADPQALRNTRVQHNIGNMTVNVGSFQGTLGIPTFESDGMLPLPPGKRLDVLSSVGQVVINPVANPITYITTVATGELYLGGGATGNVYYLGGLRNISLSAPKNTQITFQQNASTNNNHPLIITTSTSDPNSNIVSSNIVWYLDSVVSQSTYVNTSNFNGATTRYVQWTPSAAGTFYYACYVHGIGMGGMITITG